MVDQSREAHTLWANWEKLRPVDNVLYLKYDEGTPARLVLPGSATLPALVELHEALGHAGEGKLDRAARQRFWSPNLRHMVRRACNACQVCEQVKAVQLTPRAPLQPILSGYPNQRLGLDIMGPFPQSRTGIVYLLVMVDFFTKWVGAAPLPNQEARTVAEAVFTHWVVRYGTPDTIHTDQGSNFESRLVYKMCLLAGIQKTRTTPYHPQGNGQTERTNRSLLTTLRSLAQ